MPKLKRSRLRSVSTKQRQRADESRGIREDLILKHEQCMICERSFWQLVCHEIANGPNRQKALDKPYAILVLCFWCNQNVVTDKSVWPDARQLALLKLKAPENYDLAAYNALINPRAPNRIVQAEVDSYLKGLMRWRD